MGVRGGIVGLSCVLCVMWSAGVLAGQAGHETVSPTPARLLESLPDNAALNRQNLGVLRQELHRARKAMVEEQVRQRRLKARLQALEGRVQALTEAMKKQDKAYKGLADTLPVVGDGS